jgi:DNA (cytosine-5)-methyltransferase 1
MVRLYGVKNVNQEFSILDLFSGAGGLSEGFFRENFTFTCHIEKDAYASQTLETRAYFYELKKIGKEEVFFDYFSGKTTRAEFLNDSIESLGYKLNSVIGKEINGNSEKELIKIAKKRNENNQSEKIDVIIGGPPCQAYSIIGRSRDPNRMKDDPRNFLYLHYLKFLKKFKPDIFVFENVPGIQSAGNGSYLNQFKRNAEKIGYSIDCDHILNAADFLVLQNRKRIFIMGWKKEYNINYPEFSSIEHDFQVNDLLIDLPVLEPGDGSDFPQEYGTSPSEYLLKTGIRQEDDILRHHFARPNNPRDREIYRLAIQSKNNGHRIKYHEFPESLKTHKKQHIFKDRFKVIGGSEKFCHSIVAHISKDGHYFIHPDIEQARSITVREAARIQSFPDNYLFEGPRTQKFVQIGNAVPPLMANCIAKKVSQMLAEI